MTAYTTTTTTMLTEAHGDFLGEQKGRCEVFGDLGLLDKVFKALLATNKYHGRKQSLQFMLDIEQQFLGKRFPYFCDGYKWRSQIFLSDGEVI